MFILNSLIPAHFRNGGTMNHDAVWQNRGGTI